MSCTRAGLQNAAAFEDRDLIAEPQGFVQIVADKHDGLLDARLEREQFVLELGADQRVQ